jgi:cytochrome P450
MTDSVTLPVDGTPLQPSASLDVWRDQGPAIRMTFPDGHVGWLVTDYALGKKVLEDPRFSQRPQRFPGPATPASGPSVWEVDDRAKDAKVADILTLDGDHHLRLRRALLPFFSVRAIRGHEDAVSNIVNEALARLISHGSPANLTEEFSEPISAAVHCHVLGVPEHMHKDFVRLFVHQGSSRERVMFVRDVIDYRHHNPGDDAISGLIASDLSAAEVDGLVIELFTSGRDSVAYMITTATHALLSHPDQLDVLRHNLDLLPLAIEEFMRFGTMFLTVFARTPTEDVTFDDVTFLAGEAVSVSPVAANRDPGQFSDPHRFDVSRDARGHLGFGHGLHGCVGQQLARLEIRIALTTLITRLPRLALVSAEAASPMPFAHPVATYQAGALTVSWRE